MIAGPSPLRERHLVTGGRPVTGQDPAGAAGAADGTVAGRRWPGSGARYAPPPSYA
ncbi:hypothetical protein [Streptosporangium fragile]|uniref:hypothetical protein n=1 Tax=Streptosporangium fragile TaxID=46186 RepID=UPI0031ECCC27